MNEYYGKGGTNASASALENAIHIHLLHVSISREDRSLLAETNTNTIGACVIEIEFGDNCQRLVQEL